MTSTDAMSTSHTRQKTLPVGKYKTISSLFGSEKEDIVIGEARPGPAPLPGPAHADDDLDDDLYY